MGALAYRDDHTAEDGLPKGLGVVLARQREGFWSRLGDGAAWPEFSADDVPGRIYTFEPWLGCLWGASCTFCYVPNLSERHYPGGRASRWFREWGGWLVPKPEITDRLRGRLFERHGGTRPAYRGAFVFMSAKTDPFLPRQDLLRITRDNLEVFRGADLFLMCQTRSPAVVVDAGILRLLMEMAERGRVAVSFSIATDVTAEQRTIERGGLSPERRLRIMKELKGAGIFVSAAVSPLMPYSPEFAHRLLDCAHHVSVQLLRSAAFGSTTPRDVLDSVHASTPTYRELDRKLVEELGELDRDGMHSWGIGNKGFIGAFLSAERFYGRRRSREESRQLALV